MRARLLPMVIGALVGAGCGSPPEDPPPVAAPPGDTAAPAPAPEAAPYAGDLRIREVALFQAVKVTVARDGRKVEARRAPVVAGRDALLRVYVEPQPGFLEREITAELQLRASDGSDLAPPLRVTRRVSGPSSDSALTSTFNFDLPGAGLPPGVRYAVALLDAARQGPREPDSPARHPRGDGDEPLDAQAGGERLRVRLVPIRYDADGSGRLPDTSAAQVDLYRRLLHALYPVAQVEISVRPALAWSAAIRPNGEGMPQLLQALVAQRLRDGAPADLYYLGLMAPAASVSAFCSGTSACVAGLGLGAADPRDATPRACLALGFPGAGSAQAAAHVHGRRHAPCGGAAGPDPAFPYAMGGIGVWGYSLPVKRLIDPAATRDLMGYCSPSWISDYTYGALFERISFVNRAVGAAASLVSPRRYQVLDGAGGLVGAPAALADAPRGPPAEVTYVDGAGRALATVVGAYYGYDHLPGGLVVAPEAPPGAVAARVAAPRPDAR